MASPAAKARKEEGKQPQSAVTERTRVGKTSILDTKPLVIDLDGLTLGDFGLFRRMKSNTDEDEMCILIAKFFEDWTIEDARQIPIRRLKDVIAQMEAAMSEIVPN